MDSLELARGERRPQHQEAQQKEAHPEERPHPALDLVVPGKPCAIALPSGRVSDRRDAFCPCAPCGHPSLSNLCACLVPYGLQIGTAHTVLGCEPLAFLGRRWRISSRGI